jgi:hypothetical protein
MPLITPRDSVGWMQAAKIKAKVHERSGIQFGVTETISYFPGISVICKAPADQTSTMRGSYGPLQKQTVLRMMAYSLMLASVPDDALE